MSNNTQLLFSRFNLVVCENTKLEMLEISKKEGFFDILEQTWFCHTPTWNNRPCGKCLPCRRVYQEGLGWRLPFVAKLRYHSWPTLHLLAKSMHMKP